MADEESAPVVVGAGGDDGSSAEGGDGEGNLLWGVPGGKWDCGVLKLGFEVLRCVFFSRSYAVKCWLALIGGGCCGLR